MNKKSIALGVIFCIFMTILIFSMGFVEKKNDKDSVTLYQVYLNGKKIGLIENEDTLYSLIDKEQNQIKLKYGVDKVYPPKGLTITAVKTYETTADSVRNVYNRIKDEAPFTIEGYEITIKSKEKPKKFYILNKADLDEAVRNTVLSFVDKEVLDNYIAGTQPEIVDEGETLEKLSLGETIKIKEATVSTEEHIFTNSDDLSRYMLFGTLAKGKEYTVKLGDTIESVATSNMLSVNEFLIANPKIVNENALLSVGQVVNISLIEPLVTVVEETTTVEKQVIKYETTVEYDPNLSASTRYVKQEGSNGLMRVKYSNLITNGVLSNPIPLSQEEITPTINRVLVVGGVDTVYIGDSSYWGWPTKKPYKISSYFGPRWGKWHYGLDITGIYGGSYGSPIYAIQNGTVSQTGSRSDMGKHIMINHNNGYNSVYMHLSSILVKEGENVVKGQLIGLMGNSGESTGTHLHLGVWTGSSTYSNSRMINPLLLYK